MDYNNNNQQQQQYQQPQYQQPQYQPYPQQPQYQPYPQQGGTNGLAIAALACGVLSLIVVWFLGWLGIILAILSVVFGALGMKKSKQTGSGNGLAVAGLVCGIISLAICIIAIIIVACAFTAVESYVSSYSYY